MGNSSPSVFFQSVCCMDSHYTISEPIFIDNEENKSLEKKLFYKNFAVISVVENKFGSRLHDFSFFAMDAIETKINDKITNKKNRKVFKENYKKELKLMIDYIDKNKEMRKYSDLICFKFYVKFTIVLEDTENNSRSDISRSEGLKELYKEFIKKETSFEVRCVISNTMTPTLEEKDIMIYVNNWKKLKTEDLTQQFLQIFEFDENIDIKTLDKKNNSKVEVSKVNYKNNNIEEDKVSFEGVDIDNFSFN